MGSKTRLSSYCTKRGDNTMNLVTSRKTIARLAHPIRQKFRSIWYTHTLFSLSKTILLRITICDLESTNGTTASTSVFSWWKNSERKNKFQDIYCRCTSTYEAVFWKYLNLARYEIDFSFKHSHTCTTMEPLLWGHPFCIRKVAFQKGWPLIRGGNQYIYV